MKRIYFFTNVINYMSQNNNYKTKINEIKLFRVFQIYLFTQDLLWKGIRGNLDDLINTLNQFVKTSNI